MPKRTLIALLLLCCHAQAARADEERHKFVGNEFGPRSGPRRGEPQGWGEPKIAGSDFGQPKAGPEGAAPRDGERQSFAEIRHAVIEFLRAQMKESGSDYKIEVAMPDSRMQLSRCRQPLEVFVQSGGIDKGALSVGVRCRDQAPWTLYTLAQVKQFRDVVVLARPVERGAAITPEDLAKRSQDVSQLRQGYLTSFDDALKTQATRPLPAGAILHNGVLTQPKLVQRGQTVAIVAQSDTLDIRMQGKALMDGTAGQRIRVRNDKSTRIVDGIVVAPGVVQVAF